MNDLKNFVGKCEYCDSEYAVMAKTQSEANRLAEEQCECAGSNQANKKRVMNEILEELIGSDCEKLNFRPVPADVYEAIKQIAVLITEGKIAGINVKVDGTNLSIKNGAKIKVVRRYIYEQDGEIE